METNQHKNWKKKNKKTNLCNLFIAFVYSGYILIISVSSRLTISGNYLIAA